MAEDLQSSLPAQFLQRVLSLDSPLMLIRSNSNAEVSTYIDIYRFRVLNFLTCQVLRTFLDLFRTLFSVRNIPLLETVYKYITFHADCHCSVNFLQAFVG